MRRRALLANAGATLAALAGCRAPGTAADSTPTATTTTTAEPIDATVHGVVDQWGYVQIGADSIDVRDVGTPYVWADVAVADAAPGREAFALQVGDRSFAPTTVERPYRAPWGDEGWYEAGRERGLLLFAPTTDADAPAVSLEWSGGEWTAPEGFGRRLARPPPEMRATVDVPSEHAGTDAPPVAVEVTNGGDREGRFLGALNRVGPLIASTPVARLSRLVPAGETATIDVADDWSGRPDDERVGDGEPDVHYYLHWDDERTTGEIELV